MYAHNTCPYSRVALDGILLCEAYGRCRGSELKDMNAKERTRAVDAPKQVRDRKRPLKVWVTAKERTDIEIRAAGAGLSVSAYLRATGMNHPLKSVYDLAAVEELAKVGADLGRLGGLLKLWLATKRGEGAPALDVDRLLRETRELQAEMLKVMGRV